MEGLVCSFGESLDFMVHTQRGSLEAPRELLKHIKAERSEFTRSRKGGNAVKFCNSFPR